MCKVEKSKKGLKIVSVLLIVGAVLGILVAVALCSGQGQTQLLETAKNLGMEISEDAVKTAVIGFAVVVGIDALIELYLGIKGLGIEKGTYKGKAPIVIATIFLALDVLGVILNIPAVISNKADWSILISTILSAVLYYIYTKCAKEIVEG